jgi:hypothetical protein
MTRICENEKTIRVGQKAFDRLEQNPGLGNALVRAKAEDSKAHRPLSWFACCGEVLHKT